MGLFILTILKITGIVAVSNKNFFEALLPVTRDQYWYFTAYTGVFIFVPLMNKLLSNIDEHYGKIICMIFFGAFSVYATIAANIGGDPFNEKEGYSVIWLCVLYFWGASIRKFEWEKKVKLQKRKLLMISICCVLFTSLWYLLVKNIGIKLIGWSWGEKMFMSYTSPTILGLSFCLLMIFVDLKLSSWIINAVKVCAPVTFGVYLFHMQPLFASKIIPVYFKWIAEIPGIGTTIMILIVSMLILLIGIIVDRGRIWLFEVLKINRRTSKINDFIWRKIER